MTSSTGTDVSRETSVEPKDRPEHLARAVDAATMESELAAFKDPKLARGLIESIAKLSPAGGATLMEVCGTHTVAIARNGIRNLMPEGTRLASGPGCPVCVTSNRDIDTVIALARVPGITIATFGDMTRVPGSTSSLLAEQAAGRSVQIVYSPLDALTLAQQNPDREIVFVGVGFETTTPLVAMAIKRAAAAGLKNFSVFGAHKNMPGALEAIINDPQLKVDALILPGHVSTIIGAEPYRFPGVSTGSEPVDVLQGIAMIMRQLHEGRADIEIAYARGVMPEGNPVALAAIDEVFETCTALWRGLGEIPGSGYRIREEFAQFDALRRFLPLRRRASRHHGAQRVSLVPQGMHAREPRGSLHGVKRGQLRRVPPVLLKRKQALQHPKDPSSRGPSDYLRMFHVKHSFDRLGYVNPAARRRGKFPKRYSFQLIVQSLCSAARSCSVLCVHELPFCFHRYTEREN